MISLEFHLCESFYVGKQKKVPTAFDSVGTFYLYSLEGTPDKVIIFYIYRKRRKENLRCNNYFTTVTLQGA